MSKARNTVVGMHEWWIQRLLCISMAMSAIGMRVRVHNSNVLSYRMNG
jgi:hypothetical protein